MSALLESPRAATPIPPSTSADAAGWLHSHCACLRGVTQGAVVLDGSTGARTVARYPGDRPTPAWMSASARAAVDEGRRIVAWRDDAGASRACVIAEPLLSKGLVVGAVVLVADHEPDRIEGLALAHRAARFAEEPEPPARTAQRTPSGTHVLDLMHEATDHHGLKDAAAIITARLAAQFECERVSIGLRRNDLTRLVATSDAIGSEHPARSEVICAAMDEAMDNGETVVYPTPDGRPSWLIAAHAHLSERHETRALCSIPMVASGRVIGALTAERRRGLPFHADEIGQLELLARTAAPWLAQRQELDQPWHERSRQELASRFARYREGRHRLFALASTAVVAAVLAWPIDQTVDAPVKLEGAQQRIITAPADSYLQAVLARPGDTVKAGQLLLEFASEDLRVERQRIGAEMAGNDAAVGDAMARQDMGALALRLAKLGEDKAQLALLDQRLARAHVVAPFDGVVIEGDLSNALGAPAKKGDALMTLAPLGDFRAMVEIDDSDIKRIQPGQQGSMVLTALPDRRLAVVVQRITPLAAVAPGRSFFAVEVKPLTRGASTAELRPGMRGFAHIAVGRRALGAIWLQETIDRVRLAWWRWIA